MRLDRRKAHNIDQVFEVDGTPTDATGDVLVTVTRDDGTVLASGVTTTKPAGTTGVYRFALDPQADLDRLTFVYTGTWSGEVQTEIQVHELVGGHYFTESEARAADPSFIAGTYSDDDIRIVRDEVEDALESICGRAFVPRYRRATLSRGGGSLLLPNAFPRVIRSMTLDGVALTVGELADLYFEDYGAVHRSSWFSFRRGQVIYEHGEDFPPPLIKRAALLLFRAWLPAFKTSAPAGIIGVKSLSVEGYSVAYGEIHGSSSGIDEVDRLIATWRGNEPAVA